MPAQQTVAQPIKGHILDVGAVQVGDSRAAPRCCSGNMLV
jgi:hypothetical protein